MEKGKMKKRRDNKVYRTLTDEQALRLYELCQKYAREWFGFSKLNKNDLDDAISDTFVLSKKRLERKKHVWDVDRFMTNCAFKSLKDVMRNLARQNARFVSLNRDELSEALDKGRILADHGAGARRVYRQAETRTKSKPRWLVLFRYAVRKQDSNGLTVIFAFEQAIDDALRAKGGNVAQKHALTTAAQEKSSMSRRSFFYILKKIRIDFSQCFQAYREFLRQKSLH